MLTERENVKWQKEFLHLNVEETMSIGLKLIQQKRESLRKICLQ